MNRQILSFFLRHLLVQLLRQPFVLLRSALVLSNGCGETAVKQSLGEVTVTSRSPGTFYGINDFTAC
jgi:hypothetical protein